MTPEQRTQLPQYAQRELARLKQNIAYLRRKLKEGEEMDTDTVAEITFSIDRGLPRGTTVTFGPADWPRYDRLRAYWDSEKEHLYIQGGDSLVIHPQASNVVRIKQERWQYE